MSTDMEKGTDFQDTLTMAVQGSDWPEVVRLVHTNQPTDQQRHWAIEETVKCAPEPFVAEILEDCADDHLDAALSHILNRKLWRCAVRVLLGKVSTSDGGLISEPVVPVGNRDDCAWSLLLLCFEDVLEHLLQLLVMERLWESVGHILQLKIRKSQHIWAVKEACTFAYIDDFVKYILPYCLDEELEHVLSYLVSNQQCRYVDTLLERDISPRQRRWVMKEASKRTDEEDFSNYILHHCTDEDLEQVLSHMVARGLWEPADTAPHTDASIKEHILSQLVSRDRCEAVDRFLQRGVSTAHHRRVVEEESKHVADRFFADHFLPQCCPEEVTLVMPHLVSRGQWRSVDKVLERGINAAQHSWAVAEALKHADEEIFATHILHHCMDEELQQVFTHMMLRGLWKPVESDDSMAYQILSNLVSHDLWEAIGRFLEREISASHHRWVVEEASKHAVDYDFVKYILPQCCDDELECAVTHLVLRMEWGAVGEVLARGISSALHKWVVEEACKQASDDDLVVEILPHCFDEELEDMLPYLVSRGLMRSAGKVLERGIKTVHRRWVFEEFMKNCSSEKDFIKYILVECSDVELEYVTTCLVSQGMWMSVHRVLQRGISRAQHIWVLQEAAEHASDREFLGCILHHCTEDNMVSFFPTLLATQKWESVSKILHIAVCDALYTWITLEHDSTACDTLFWKFIHKCHVQQSAALDLTNIVIKEVVPISYMRLSFRTSWKRPLCEVIVRSLSLTLCQVMLADERGYTGMTERARRCVSDVYNLLNACVYENEQMTIQNKEKWLLQFTEMADSHQTDPLFILYFLQGLNQYHISRRGYVCSSYFKQCNLFALEDYDDDILLVILSVMPLFPQLQSAALRMLLREKRWDVLSQACLSHVWEHDRRQLFKAAVEQGQWRLVRQWADHTVHDDQRDWAMKEALKAKQWKAYLLLADHGLTLREQMHAHYMVAKYGNWNTVLQMVERGGDITEVSNLLETWVTGNLRLKPRGDATPYFERCKKLIRLKLRFIRNSTLSPTKVLKNCMWGSVWFSILHEPTEEYFSQVMHTVIKEQEWHILMHLVRLGMNRAERDWLFPQMVRQQQWGVCRKLLEIGVDVQLCLEALPELIEKNQWTLVARVMEYDVDDAVRREVMQCAFQRREGVLFWHCLTTMKNKEPLPLEIQRKLFHQAISREIWQAVKPLMVENDAPRVQHRDMAFLEAIEQHLWDVVDYCQIYDADINMEDENGETPLHREARKEEWKAVEEIVFRDGKPNLLDKDGISILNRLIENFQWESAKFVIKYGANIHLPARRTESVHVPNPIQSPMQSLIDKQQMDVIELTLMWCSDQGRAVNSAGETAMHAACVTGSWDILPDLIARKVNPLAVTKAGLSALAYAVLSMKCPERMVAECCRLGFATHQTALTNHHLQLNDIVHDVYHMWRLGHYIYCHPYFLHDSVNTSPLVCAVLRDLPSAVLMLYHSGSCSYRELTSLYSQLPKLIDFDIREWEDHYRIRENISGPRLRYSKLRNIPQRYMVLLKPMVEAPHTLLSLCRLVISHHLTLQKQRLWHIDRLPLPGKLKTYLKFSEFFSPDFGGRVT